VPAFLGQDKRGYRIAFPQNRWDHAKDHFTVVKGTWQTVMSHWENSPLVLDNLPLVGSKVGPPRLGDERYVCWVPGWDQYLIVPVVTLSEQKNVDGYTLSPGTRIGWTAYTDPQIPEGNVIWDIKI
jgi:hypothetical protein